MNTKQLHQHSCKVVIEGLEPGMLLHNPASMLLTARPTAAKVIPSPEDEAARACYWTPDHKSIALPAKNLRSGLVQACAGLKLPANKKLMLSPIVAGDVSVWPVFIPFGTKEYVVDIQRALVQRQGIMRARPLLFPWTLTFEIRWESANLGVEFASGGLLQALLERLGTQIGLGDYRPAKKGPYGRFLVVSIV